MKLFLASLLIILSTQVYAEKLRLIGDYNMPTGEKFKDTEIGGLSGLSFDSKSKKLFIISDDRSNNNPARYYQFDLDISEKKFSVKPSDVIFLKDEKGNTFKKNEVDFEGITIINDHILVSSEGALNKDKPILPAVFEFSFDGKFIKNFEIPEKFLPSKVGEVKYGARDNLVFEALSSLGSGNSFLLGTEEALLQDDNVSTPTNGSKSRVIFYQDGKAQKEMIYPIDQVPAVAVAGLTVGETGLVDFAMIDENSTYSIERAFLPLTKKTFIKIFKVTGLKDATDVSKFDSIKGKEKEIKMLDKELILNIDEITSTLSDKFKSTDNIEGICFGPTLSNGHKTLILVSDNNFSKVQRTQFLAFEIIP